MSSLVRSETVGSFHTHHAGVFLTNHCKAHVLWQDNDVNDWAVIGHKDLIGVAVRTSAVNFDDTAPWQNEYWGQESNQHTLQILPY